MKPLDSRVYAQDVYSEFGQILKSYGYSSTEEGCYELEVSKGFYHLFTVSLLTKRQLGFCVLVGVRDDKVSSCAASLVNESYKLAKVKFKVSRRPPSMIGNLGYLTPDKSWRNWYLLSRKDLLESTKQSVELFAVYGISYLKGFRDRNDLYHLLVKSKEDIPLTIAEEQIPLIYAWCGDMKRAKDYIDSKPNVAGIDYLDLLAKRKFCLDKIVDARN